MDRLSSTRSPMPSINEKGLWSQARPEDLFQAGAEELVLPEAWSVQCSRSGGHFALQSRTKVRGVATFCTPDLSYRGLDFCVD